MKNNDKIRIAAQGIYHNVVTLRVNELNGCEESELKCLESRLDKAIDWAIDNGEFRTLKQICHQMFSVQSGVSREYREVSSETFEEYFECPYILGKEMRGEI